MKEAAVACSGGNELSAGGLWRTEGLEDNSHGTAPLVTLACFPRDLSLLPLHTYPPELLSTDHPESGAS